MSEFGAGNDVTYKLAMFHLEVGKDTCVVAVSTVSPNPHITAHYMIVCTRRHKNNKSIDTGNCTEQLFNDAQNSLSD